MIIPRAVLDACVLYPPSLRDLLMWLAAERAYAPRWTETIHEEWMRNVLADRPDVTSDHLQRTRQLMDRVAPGVLVTGHEAHIPVLILPDPNDRHVLAAAIEAKAPLIVTYNRKDFPARLLGVHGVQAVHPDAFLEGLLDERPDVFLRGIRSHWESLRSPPKTAEAYRDTLRANGLRQLAARIEALGEPS